MSTVPSLQNCRTELNIVSRLIGNGRLSELPAPNWPVRYAFQRQPKSVDFIDLSTRHRPQAAGQRGV
jgi:hypothetical protein